MIHASTVRNSARFSAHCMDLPQTSDEVITMSATAEPRLATTGEAARHLGVNPRTLLKWAQDGSVRPDLITPGGHLRWDVERLLDDLRRARVSA